MALRPLNALDGLSVSENSIQIIFANGFVSATSLAVTNEADLGNIGNVTISGGSSGQVLTTDGSGNLSFTTPSTAGGNIYVYTRSSGVVNIEVSIGKIIIVGRSGNIDIPVEA